MTNSRKGNTVKFKGHCYCNNHPYIIQVISSSSILLWPIRWLQKCLWHYWEPDYLRMTYFSECILWLGSDITQWICYTFTLPRSYYLISHMPHYVTYSLLNHITSYVSRRRFFWGSPMFSTRFRTSQDFLHPFPPVSALIIGFHNIFCIRFPQAMIHLNYFRTTRLYLLVLCQFVLLFIILVANN